MPAAPRTRASLSAGTRPVAAIRSATSSASALIGGAPLPIPAPPGDVALPGTLPGLRKFGGRSMSIYPSFEVSAGEGSGLMPTRGGSGNCSGRTPFGVCPRPLLERIQVSLEDRRAPEERNHGAEREEGAERDAHLAGLRAVACEEDE